MEKLTPPEIIVEVQKQGWEIGSHTLRKPRTPESLARYCDQVLDMLS